MQRRKKLLTLASYINTDEDALVCDLAETYNIYDYRSLPLKTVATFSVGLRDNSRIKMKINGLKCSVDTILMASAVDQLAFIAWSNTVDGQKNRNRPKSILKKLVEDNAKVEGFATLEDFNRARAEILEKK